MFKKIVVGFDGSHMADRGLQLACDLAQKYNAEVHLVHTPQSQTVAFAMGAMAEYSTAAVVPTSEEIEASNAKILAQGESIAKDCGVTVSNVHVARGDPADVIVGYADEIGSDLIVTGRHGHGALRSIIQGSTSLRINHIAKCVTMSVV